MPESPCALRVLARDIGDVRFCLNPGRKTYYKMVFPTGCGEKCTVAFLLSVRRT